MTNNPDYKAQLFEAWAETEKLWRTVNEQTKEIVKWIAWTAEQAFERGKEEGAREQREKDAIFLENILNSGPPHFWPVNSYQKTILVDAAQAIRGGGQ